jgi:Ca-activated chloride channel family protein
METVGMIDFGQPGYFALGAVVLAMATLSFWLRRWQRQARQQFAGPQGDRWRTAATWPRLVLVLLAAVLIVFAAARPQWGSSERVRERSGIDLVIVLDVSQSMQAQDVSPSRFGLARDELVKFVESMRGSRVGLVFFAGSAFLRSPLTTDVQAISQLIQNAELDVGLTNSGSDLGGGLRQAATVLEASESAGKAVIVVSDGEDHVGNFFLPARTLRDQSVSVFSFGVGTPEGSTLLEPNPRGGAPRTKVDSSGQPVVTRLQEASLRIVAQESGGSYQRLTSSVGLSDLRGQLSRLQQTPLGDEIRQVPIERFQPFIIAALILLAESWLLPARFFLPALRFGRLRPHPSLSILIVALLIGACGGGDSIREDNAAANALFEAGDYQGALAAYEALLARRPDLPALSYNAGNALHRLENYERAVVETQRALPPRDSRLGAITHYAMGNHLLALGRVEEAYDSYRSALLLDPNDLDAKHNLEVTLLILSQSSPQPGPDGAPSGEQPQPGGEQPQPGTPATPTPPSEQQQQQSTEQNLQSFRDLIEALRGIDEDLTFGEAVHILDLLREQQQQQRPDRPGAAPGPDY